MKKKWNYFLGSLLIALNFMIVPIYAETGNVSSVIQEAWQAARTQIITVVNNVIFPICDTVLVVFFFIKLSLSYFDYRKQGMFDWTAPAILFVCLCFCLTAPNYIWNII